MKGDWWKLLSIKCLFTSEWNSGNNDEMSIEQLKANANDCKNNKCNDRVF